jgi:hypothetical protein
MKVAKVCNILLSFSKPDYRGDYVPPFWILSMKLILGVKEKKLFYRKLRFQIYRECIILFSNALSLHLDQLSVQLFIKDEVLLTVNCPIFPSILIAKNLLTGSLKNRSIDNLETQKKSISIKNSQFFDYLLYAKSKKTFNKILIKKSLSTKLPME